MSARLAPSSRPLPSLFVAFLPFFVLPWPSPLRVINVIIIITARTARQGRRNRRARRGRRGWTGVVLEEAEDDDDVPVTVDDADDDVEVDDLA